MTPLTFLNEFMYSIKVFTSDLVIGIMRFAEHRAQDLDLLQLPLFE